MSENRAESEVEDNDGTSDSYSSSEDDADKESTIVKAEDLFGKKCYVACTRNLPTERHIGMFPYRDSGCMLSLCPEAFTTDKDVIAQFLSQLSFYELNEIDREVFLYTVLKNRNSCGVSLPLNLLCFLCAKDRKQPSAYCRKIQSRWAVPIVWETDWPELFSARRQNRTTSSLSSLP